MKEGVPIGDEVAVAVIGKYRGNKGEVFLRPYFDISKESIEGREVTLRWPDGRERRMRVTLLWQHRHKTICNFESSGSISDACELRHAEMFIAKTDLQPLEDNEYFIADLTGCKVFLADGEKLGEVTEIINTKGSVVLVVAGQREYLIPLAEAIVPEIDISKKQITVNPPEGLLEINEN